MKITFKEVVKKEIWAFVLISLFSLGGAAYLLTTDDIEPEWRTPSVGFCLIIFGVLWIGTLLYVKKTNKRLEK